jgi:thiol:disulfide interchange protein DsbC
MTHSFSAAAAVLALCTAVSSAWADEASIRKNLAERMPNLPKLDEVQKSPIAGVYEVRIGSDILYTDEDGNYLIQGEIYDTKGRINVTQARIDKLSAIDFAKLPLKDAIAIKQGNGTRKMAVFVDPNCGYCKRFERDVATLKDVTVYTFLYPILGPDSVTKSRDIWCAKDPGKAWRDWMIGERTPPSVGDGKCDSGALARNTELGRKHRVQGTPATVFVDGTRLPGAVPLDRLEKQLASASKG